MASFLINGAPIAFAVEPEQGMYPQPLRGETDVRRYRCKASVASLTVLGQLDAAAAQATFFRALGQPLWVAVLGSGNRGTLTFPGAGQGVNAVDVVQANAILTSVTGRGQAAIDGRVRVELEFALPDLV